MQNKVVICLGSNSDCESNLRSAGRLLQEYFDSICFSEPLYTEPVGWSGSGSFLNQVAVADTYEPFEAVRQVLKEMEIRLGRSSESKRRGQIPIDIDLLLWNGQVLKPADWERDYVQLLFRSLSDSDQNDIGGDQKSNVV